MITKKSKLNFFDRLLLWLNGLLSIAILISYLAPIADPSKYWLVAFFGLAYPILLLISFIFIVYWLLRKSIWILLPIITIALGWGVLNKNIGLRFSTKPGAIKNSTAIRIMTYNVHNFKRYGEKNDISTKKEILHIIAAAQPDIIGIQEFYSRLHGQYDMVDSIKKTLKTNSFYLVNFETSSTEVIGMAIFSKYPIVAHGFIPLSDDKTSGNQCLYIDVKKGDKVFRLYSVHLQSIRFDPEDYHYLNGIWQKGKTDMHSTKRLGSKLKTAFIKRSLQVFKLKAHAAQCPYPYIISGDFNDTPSSFAVNEMSKGLKNAFTEKGSGFGKTYNGDFPNFQIDYIMASPVFNVLNYEIVEKRLSDHYPVISDVELK